MVNKLIDLTECYSSVQYISTTQGLKKLLEKNCILYNELNVNVTSSILNDDASMQDEYIDDEIIRQKLIKYLATNDEIVAFDIEFDNGIYRIVLYKKD